MAHVRRSAPLRTRGNDNTENAPLAKVAGAATGKATVSQAAPGNALKQGARRAALTDVSNRAALAPVAGPSKQQQAAISVAVKPAKAMTKPGRKQPVPDISRVFSHAETFGRDKEMSSADVSEDDSNMDDDEEGNMEVESSAEANRATALAANPHAIMPGSPVLAPLMTQEDDAVLHLLADGFVDEFDEWEDISMVQEYADEIFTYMHTLEERLMPNAHYMNHQTELEWKMRGILIDWLVQVHGRFHLLPETLFLTINYIDRFLSAKTVSLHKLQLVGATALFVASKYEEIQCPSVSEVIYMVDNGYTAEELLMAERFMIGMLDFELGWPGPMSFLRRISKADDYDIDTRTIAKYLLETMLMSHLFVACPPSFAAAIANFLARKVLGRKVLWTDAHVYFSTYTEAQIVPAAEVLVRECLEDGRTRHGAIFDKYSDKRQKKVALFVEQWLLKQQRTAH